jgi:hypothetical protein
MTMTTRDLASNIRKINSFNSSKETNRYNKYILLTDAQTKSSSNAFSSYSPISPTFKTEFKKNTTLQSFTPRFRNLTNTAKSDKQLSNTKFINLDFRSIPKNVNHSSEIKNPNSYNKVFNSFGNIYLSDLRKSDSKSINEAIAQQSKTKLNYSNRINTSNENIKSLTSKLTNDSTENDYKSIISQKNNLIKKLYNEKEDLKGQVRIYLKVAKAFA